ncbi:branched-chain amino acid ABC transporter permease [bacterium]|nr:branched-chain amino acid ABC transporter permease [bacterium]
MINPYWELIILLCLINIIFTVSLNLILGYNGQFSLGHAGFLAIGCYTSGALTANLGWPLWAGILMSIVMSIIGAVIIGYPCLRLRGDYLAIATLGFAEILRIMANAIRPDLFGGPTGMQNVKSFYKYIPVPEPMNGVGNLLFTILFTLVFFALLVWGIWALASFLQRIINRRLRWDHWRWLICGLVVLAVIVANFACRGALFYRIFGRWHYETGSGGARIIDKAGIFHFFQALTKDSFASPQWAMFALFIVVVAIVTWMIRNYLISVPGRAVVAIREDEIAATNLGLNCTWMKLQNFMFGSALAGLAGAMLAHTIPLFKPMDFNFFKSVDVLLMVVLGGMGSITGSFVGATIITVLLEALRFLGDWRLVMYSLILILFMIFKPGGLLGSAELGQLIRRRAETAIQRLVGDDPSAGSEARDA